ncbi:MAG: halocarboxylic acid dehydrogenase DehI family protein [Gemmatimonadota bacterium]|jgi:hypothetical protein|nr:halocarboxylic acid dehydrogenase DehI family protein [Gemmatimonadota bacterium]
MWSTGGTMPNEGEQEEIRRGMELAAHLPDIMPDQASQQVGKVYDEVQETLRVPIVNLIFRVLANYPDYLEQTWERLRPALRTRSFERAADEIRAGALLEPVPGASRVHWEETGDLDRIRAFNDTIHYVLPKLLLIATALDELGFGPTPGGSHAETAADPSEIPTGVAEGTTKVKMVEPEKADERVRTLFESVKNRHGHPLVSSYYRGLGNWPDFLDAAWTRVGPLVGSAAYEARKDALITAARTAVRELPISAEGMEGPDEAQRAEIRDLLAAFRLKFIPEMLLDVMLIKALVDGPEQARVSPFSVAQESAGAG